MITVSADEHIYRLSDYLPDEIELHLFNPDEGLPDALRHSDALMIRTVTPIGRENLSPLAQNLKFLATATAGYDHVDTHFLRTNGITFAHAGGCNARSVAEYAATALLIWAEERLIDLRDEVIGIIGAGHTGTKFSELLTKLDIKHILYDPPRAEMNEDFTSATRSELLECPILSLHPSLTDTGRHPSYHWLDSKIMFTNKFKLIVNTSRGAVIDETALLQAYEVGRINDMILDVWENEPLFNSQLAALAFYGTPHIAGYSIEAKLRATKMITDALCDHFNITPVESTEREHSKTVKKVHNNTGFDTLGSLLKKIHPIDSYDKEMRHLIGEESEKRRIGFRRLRTDYPLRNEFSSIQLPSKLIRKFPELFALGLR